MTKKLKLEAIELSGDLIRKARTRLEERGIELELYLSMHLRTMLRSRSVLSLQDSMPFGKYQGELVENVCRADPGYMAWLVGQNGKTQFEHEVLQLLDDIAE